MVMVSGGGGLYRIGAVSYTHLDVYKRQGVYCIAPTIALAGEPQKLLSCCNKLGEFEAQGSAIAQYPGLLADWRWSKIEDGPLPSAIEGEKGAILNGKWDTMSPLTLCLRGQEPKPIPIQNETRCV